MSKTEYFLGGIYYPLSPVVKQKADVLKKEFELIYNNDNNDSNYSFKRGEFIRKFNEEHKDCQINYSDIW